MSQRTDTAARKILKFGCLPALALVVLLIIIGSTLDSDDDKTDTKASASTPRYKVVDQDDTGNKRNVVVEVDSTNNLRAVFGAVTKSLSEEAGYYIMINCSTGGTSGADNRLANGQYAIGRMGQATTGLDDGDTEFSTNQDRACPDKT